MPTITQIRAALREKFGARQYRIGSCGSIHVRMAWGWAYKGHIIDPLDIALLLNLGPLALSAADFQHA